MGARPEFTAEWAQRAYENSSVRCPRDGCSAILDARRVDSEDGLIKMLTIHADQEHGGVP